MLLVVGLIGCSPRACEPGEGAAGAPRGLILGTTQEPDTVDPAFTQTTTGLELMRLLFRDLTELDDQWQLTPSAAAALPTWTAATSTLGPTVHWRLRPGLKWSDGHPVTSADAVFGWQVERRDDLPSVSHAVAAEVAELVPEGELGFAVTWRRPYADYRAPRVHALLPAHAYPPLPAPKAGGAFLGFGKQGIVGNGPFRLIEWVPGRLAVVEPNPHWPGPRPALARITFRFYTGEDALEAALLAGEVDGTVSGSGLSLEAGQALAERLAPERIVEWSPSGTWLHLEPKLDDPWLGQAEVREAIDRAIDRQVLCTLAYGGHAVPATGLFPPRHPAHVERPSLGVDLEAARALIARAQPKESPVILEYAAGNPGAERAATYVHQQLRAIGLPAVLSPLAAKLLLERMNRRAQGSLVLYAFRARPDWDGRSLLRSDGRQNGMGYRSAAVDGALDRAASSLDPGTWAQAVREAEAQALADRAVIPLAFREELAIRPKGLVGFRPTGVGPITWNAETWRLEAPAER